MAPISGLGGVSSIYETRNIISGLASGMDTEAMIENAVSGIKMKISGLNQKRTKVGWQQTALRSIIDKMANFSQKYTSYTSGTNLFSASFFNNAVKTTTGGAFADKISATGKTSSDVKILGVEQLARNATYRISGIAGSGGDIVGDKAISLADDVVTSSVTGDMTIYDGNGASFDIKLTEEDMKDVDTSEELVKKLNDKLADFKNKDGDARLTAKLGDDGTISFESKGGNEVSIRSASGEIEETLGIKPGKDTATLKVPADGMEWTKTTPMAEALDGKEIGLTLDGVTKKIALKAKNEDGDRLTNAEFFADMKSKVEDAFGGKVKLEDMRDDSRIQLKFTAPEGSTLSVSSSVGKTLGLKSDSESNFLDTSKSLGELLGDKFPGAGAERAAAVGKVTEFTDKNGEVYYKDENGNKVVKDGEDADGNPLYYRVGAKGETLYDFKVNGVSVGAFSKDTAMESVLTAINNNADAGVNVSYSKLTNEFRFSAKESGANGKIEFSGLAKELFGAGGKGDPNFTAGQDAKVKVSINDKEMNLTRSNNNFDLEGLSVTLKDTFGYTEKKDADGNVVKDDVGNPVMEYDSKTEAVTFKSAADSEKIVTAIKDMVKDYNEMATEIRKAYTTVPSYKSGGQRYEPLTDEERADLSEEAAKAYEEKAKEGILFADRDLSSLSRQLTDAIGLSGRDGAILRSIGIETSYSQGATTLTVDEEKLKAALENNPDQVRDIFTKSTENGSSTDGLMASMKKTLDEYGKTTGMKGILVERAGSIKAPATLHNNALQEIMDNYDKQIERWSTKLADQVDSYTRKFSQLEQLIAQMNSQSSSMAGLMMGGQ